MKTKTLQQDPLTKKDLIEIINDLRNDFRKELNREISGIEIRLEIKLEKMELRIDDRARIYNSQILTRFDQWANDLKTAQTERVVTADQLTKLRNSVNVLEKRVTKLENN